MKKFKDTKKKIMFGNNRSKALNITKRTWKLNLQKYTKIDSQGKEIVVYLTAREIRTLKKKKTLT